MTQNTLVYHWIAQYSDGMSLPQYDPNTFRENAFGDIDLNKVIKFGLYPFSKNLAIGVRRTGQSVVSVPILPIYEVNLDKNKRLIHYRDVYISQESYHLCNKCNKEFTYDTTIQKIDSKYSSPICPNCGAHDLFVCKNKACGKVHKRFEDAKFGMCECGSHLKRIRITSKQHFREMRWVDYYLGSQTTVNGTNIKFLMKISEKGDCEIL